MPSFSRQRSPLSSTSPPKRPLVLPSLAHAPVKAVVRAQAVDDPPIRPVLAVIQPPGGRRDGGAGADSGSGRHEAMRRARLEEQRGQEKGTRAPAVGHARSASDGALARSLAPLPTSHAAAAAPAPSASAAPIHRVPVRSYSEPIRPSPLAPRASLSAHHTSRRGRSPSIHSLSPSAPLSSYPPRPALAPLSRRYTRPASHAHLSLRSPVQERSVPHFSRAPLLARQSDRAEEQRRLLVESLVLAALERRLGERLVRSRSAAVGEKAGLGGLKAGREMWLWCAVKRCREREGVQALAHPPRPPSPFLARKLGHQRSSSSPATSTLREGPPPVYRSLSDLPPASALTSSSGKIHLVSTLSSFPPLDKDSSTAFEFEDAPLALRVIVRVELPTSPKKAFLRPLPRAPAPTPSPPRPRLTTASQSATYNAHSPFAAPTGASSFAGSSTPSLGSHRYTRRTAHGFRLPHPPAQAANAIGAVPPPLFVSGPTAAAEMRERDGKRSGRGIEDWSRHCGHFWRGGLRNTGGVEAVHAVQR